ncbi:MAG TPA: hypothetical protein VL326_30010 [Kofleriaceae bacterium]|nr:hypothetical protein [Kofleriaceae bacterium]
MKRALFPLLAALLVAPFAISSAATVPGTITFAARIVDDKTEAELTGSHTATFALYDAETGGNSVWNESHPVEPEEGMIYVELGSQNALDTNIFDGKQLWLQISVDGNTMEPRVALASVPYAVRAAAAAKADDSDKLGGIGLDGLQQKVTGTCNTGQYLKGINPDGTVVCADDQSGVGDITAVAAGSGLVGGATSGQATLALIGCNANEILKSTGTGWMCGTDADTGDITAVTAGAGLVGGGTSGAVTLGLPTSCGMNQLLKWNGSAWACAADVDTDTDTNSGGTITGVSVGAPGGLMGGGTTGAVTLSLPNTCGSGQMLKWSGTVWQCATDTDTNSGGTLTGVIAGNGLVGGGTSGSPTVNVGQGVGISVGTDTISIDTTFTDTRYLQLTGGAMSGSINMAGGQITNRGCPTGFTSMGGTLCIESTDKCCYTFSAAANRCRAAGAHLCSSVEIRAAMQSGVTIGNGVGQDWMGDQDGNDSALFVDDSTSAENPDGSRATTSSSWSRCCVELE